MKITWTGAVGLAILMSVLFAGTGLYMFKDRLTLSPVVVTTETIPGCTRIEASMVKVIRIPRMGIPPGTARTLEDVDRLWTSCGYAIPKNSFVYLAHALPEDESVTGIMHHQPSGLRLMTIPVEPTASLGGKIRPGDRIDLWFVSRPQKPSGIFVGKLFDNLEIVSLQDAGGNELGRQQDAAKKGILSFSAPVSSTPTLAYLTIRLKETDIPYVLLAEQEGKLLPVARGAATSSDSGFPADAKAWLNTKMEGSLP